MENKTLTKVGGRSEIVKDSTGKVATITQWDVYEYKVDDVAITNVYISLDPGGLIKIIFLNEYYDRPDYCIRVKKVAQSMDEYLKICNRFYIWYRLNNLYLATVYSKDGSDEMAKMQQYVVSLMHKFAIQDKNRILFTDFQARTGPILTKEDIIKLNKIYAKLRN